MKHTNILKIGLLDVLTGLLGLVLLMALDFHTPIKFDLRWFFTIGAVFGCVLGFLRSGGVYKNPWVQGLLISSGFGVPLMVLSLTGMGLDTGILIAFLVVSSATICSGVLARQNWRGGKRLTSAICLLIPIACVALASISVVPPLMTRLSGQHVNQPAAEFSLTTDDGRVLSSAELRGKVVILAFWASWCEPCWHELPRVANLYATYRDNRSVLFWAVNAQAGGDTIETARAYAKKMRIALPVAYTDNTSAVRLGVNGYPKLIILDTEGRLRFIHDGYDASERLESSLAHEIDDLMDHRQVSIRIDPSRALCGDWLRSRNEREIDSTITPKRQQWRPSAAARITGSRC